MRCREFIGSIPVNWHPGTRLFRRMVPLCLGLQVADDPGTHPGTLRVAPVIFGEMGKLQIYDRYLRTLEAAGSYRAGV
jgi:hypothetical protein